MLKKGAAVRFYVLACTSRPPYTDLYAVTEADLDAGVTPPVSPPFCNIGEDPCEYIPDLAGYCCFDDNLYLIGGLRHVRPTNLLLSLPAEAVPSPPTNITPEWRITGTSFMMKQHRVFPNVIPYEGRIFIFGGCLTRYSWIEIYDPNKDKLFDRDVPAHVFEQLRDPKSCFLWHRTIGRADGTDEHRKKPIPPLVMLCSNNEAQACGKRSRLWSYDVQNDRWQMFDPSFPACPPGSSYVYRNLIPRGNTLFIIDYAGAWSIYDLSDKKVVQRMHVLGLGEAYNHEVIEAFCQPSSCGSEEESLIFTIFMYGSGGPNMEGYGIPFAKVRVTEIGEKRSFIAEVERQGVLDVGCYYSYSIFAHQIDETEKKKQKKKKKKKKKNKNKKKNKKKLLEAVEFGGETS